jgi:DNA-binding MarR family transcriptional regulator
MLPQLLGYRLRLAQRAVFDDFNASMADTLISPGLFGILVIIEANPGLKQSELAQAAQLDRSSIVPVVDKLEARALVERRGSERDRRVNGLWLTARGGALLAKLKRRVLAHEQRVARALSEQERAQLFELLSRVVRPDAAPRRRRARKAAPA